MADAVRMRVGIEVGKAAGISDGIGRYCRCLLRALLELEDGPELLLYDLSDDRLAAPHRPCLRRRKREAVDDRQAIDLFHSTGAAVPAPGSVPLVVTVHDLTVLSHPHFHTPSNRARVTAALVSAAARGALVIAVSAHTRRQVVERLGVAEERVAVIHEAPDPAFLGARGAAQEARSLRPGPGRPYVLAVGSLEPRKNLLGLLDGMMLLPAATRREVTLVLAGPGGWRNRSIAERLAQARHTVRVREVGYVSTEELVGLYRGATVFAYPSLVEGFGLPVLEAMACGTPVLASDRASLPEVAGDAALLVDPEEPAAIAAGLERLLDDQRLRGDLVSRGFANVERFGWDRCARATVAVYLRAATGG